MKVIVVVLLVLMLCLTVTGCSSPYWAADTSKTLTEIDQLKEAQAQTKLMERQTIALETMARCMQTK